MNFIKMNVSFVAFMAILGFSSIVASPAAAQVAVEISQEALSATAASCTSGDACAAAVQALIDQLVAANPGTDVALVIGSVVSAIAAGYNAGSFPAVAAQFALASASSIASASGLTELAATAAAAATTVASGDAIDLEAVAEASGSPA